MAVICSLATVTSSSVMRCSWAGRWPSVGQPSVPLRTCCHVIVPYRVYIRLSHFSTFLFVSLCLFIIAVGQKRHTNLETHLLRVSDNVLAAGGKGRRLGPSSVATWDPKQTTDVISPCRCLRYVLKSLIIIRWWLIGSKIVFQSMHSISFALHVDCLQATTAHSDVTGRH